MRRAEIERLLPAAYRVALDPPPEWGLGTDEALAALLDAMEAMHHPIEQLLDEEETLVDPRRTRAELVPYLCGWLDLDWLFRADAAASLAQGSQPLASGLGRLREVAAAAAESSRWRGTQRGLRRFLEAATGVAGFAIIENREADGSAVAFHITVQVPADAASLAALIERIVRAEKPAYVTHELEIVP